MTVAVPTRMLMRLLLIVKGPAIAQRASVSTSDRQKPLHCDRRPYPAVTRRGRARLRLKKATRIQQLPATPCRYRGRSGARVGQSPADQTFTGLSPARFIASSETSAVATSCSQAGVGVAASPCTAAAQQLHHCGGPLPPVHGQRAVTHAEGPTVASEPCRLA